MKTLVRFVISTIVVATVVVLLNGIGWAAVFFWKSEAIAWACTIPTLILCPVAVISVVPLSTLDTPLFFVPMLITCCMFWGAIITWIWNHKHRKSQNQKLEGISGNARVPCKPSASRWLNEIKTKITIAFVAGLAVGFCIHAFLASESSVTDHWRVVREHRAYVLDPANYTPDSQTGLSATEPPNDPLPSLAALVAAGELNHIDIVLPTVPYQSREANRFWMNFCSKHDGIIHALGNPSYVAFPVKGDQPLHLNLWFTDATRSDIRRLISELQKIKDKETGKANQ